MTAIFLVSCPPRCVGPDYIASPFLLRVSLWVLLDVFSCKKKIFSDSSQVIQIDSCSVSSCNSRGSLVRGEFRVFLLHNLSYLLII